MAMLDAALAYAKRGWPIFPCNSAKEPLVKDGVLAATTDLTKIGEWWARWPRAGIGLDVAGAGMMVLDLDPGHDRAALSAAVGGLPETLLRQRTPRGGEHLFYALNPGEIVSPSASKLSPKVDVRSFHSYVLLTPSITADGTYTWESEGKPAFRTDEMVRLANSHREKSGDRDTWIIPADLDENVAAAIEWLKGPAKVSIEGQGGEAMAYATAAHMKSFGISEALAFDLIWDHWNPRCVPPWGADEVDHLLKKVENGYAYNTSPPGNITTAYRAAKALSVFKPVQTTLPSGLECVAGRFRFVDRDGMAHIRAPSWLVQDFLLQDTYAMLVGAPGTFKTFVALDVALSVVTGFSVDPLWTVLNRGPVLYTAGEGRSSIANRVTAWERTHWGSEKAQGFILGDPVPHVSEDWEPFIRGSLALSKNGFKLVVIDTVSRAMAGLNENAQEHASKLTQKVDQLKRELGCTVLCLHHSGHESGKRGRGSSVFLGDPDTLVTLDRPQDKSFTISLTMTKQKDAPEWSKPRVVKLVELELGKGLTSLVATAPDAGAKPPKVSRATEAVDLILDNVYDRAIRDILAGNPLQALNTKDLSEIMAAREEIDVGSGTLAHTRGPLKMLRERKGTYAHKAYDPRRKLWRFYEEV